MDQVRALADTRRISLYLQIARLDHWIKNIFVLPGLASAAAFTPLSEPLWAGPAALLVAKLHKLGERDQRDPTRLIDKDAHDVYRLLVAVDTENLAGMLKMLLSSNLAAPPTQVALAYFNELFVGGPDAPGPQMAGRAEALLGDPATVAQSVAALASDLARAVGR